MHSAVTARSRVYAALLAVLVCRDVFAASPVQTSVIPRGGQRGTEVELTLTGDRLADAQQLLRYKSGIAVKNIQPTTQQVKVQVAIAPDALLG